VRLDSTKFLSAALGGGTASESKAAAVGLRRELALPGAIPNGIAGSYQNHT